MLTSSPPCQRKVSRLRVDKERWENLSDLEVALQKNSTAPKQPFIYIIRN